MGLIVTTQPFPSGTAMLFQQTTAPVGWTKSTAHNDKALRVVSGTADYGGTVAFSTVFSTLRDTSTVTVTGSVDSTTLSVAQMPSHAHQTWVRSSDINGVESQGYPANDYHSAHRTTDRSANRFPTLMNSTGGGGSHNHSLSMNAHAHSSNLNVQYVDVIIATKD